MLFKEFKEKQQLKNIQEIIINKKVNIRGIETLILSFINYNGNSMLWTLHKNVSNREEVNSFENNTNREDLVVSINSNSQHIHFSQINIGNNKVNFTSSQQTSIQYAYGKELIIINYFIENGLISNEWDDVDIEDMIFSSYEQNEEEEFPVINDSRDIEITLQIDEETREKLIQHPITLKLGKYEKDSKIYYKDYDGKENYFYIDEIVKYDLWEKTLEDIEANINHVEEEYRETYKKDFMNGVENTCPKDMDYTAIYYETRENEQLRFLSKEYLEKKPVYNSSSIGMIWMSENEQGVNGFIQYTDGLQPVEKNFDENLEIELFSKFITIPKETITFIL